ncbi:MAG: 50S ribosomal protein L6 [Candidatus Staskawiczbacteria bacterium CG10_big_fil_rev_8_21_14_0_10_38_10]|uniref:50S ribosomal protein L6 n=1 Tax=Candidatus Staskawiczbacteria bacterium CG10_big_fil_rev_8_21_14_0_10_38_10 TaxID=1974891 RepID=A0A2H9T260_9BACT|nr:MAG: 50S ribosomal protein L6 [Candidatus Staskawiczbacteria bacterium CG10_big_fil_rev_8_21_14_0_10_38_10]
MSRIGKKLIELPEGVNINKEGETLKVSGPKGEIVKTIPSEIKVEVKEGKVFVSLQEKGYLAGAKKHQALWGLYRSLINNWIRGVKEEFYKKLEIEGIGYKAVVEKEGLVLNVGFTHPVKIKCPEGIKFLVEKNIITVSGIDREKVGQIAAIIRKAKKAEPYKGKGIKYVGEKIRRKEGKRVVAAKTQ